MSSAITLTEVRIGTSGIDRPPSLFKCILKQSVGSCGTDAQETILVVVSSLEKLPDGISWLSVTEALE